MSNILVWKDLYFTKKVSYRSERNKVERWIKRIRKVIEARKVKLSEYS